MILAFSWIDHCIFLIMSSLKKVHLINVCFKNEMEDFELLNISLVFTSSFYDCSDDLLLVCNLTIFCLLNWVQSNNLNKTIFVLG